MATENTFVTGNVSYSETEISLPRPVRFWLLLLLDIPSVACSFFVIYHLSLDRAMRSQLHHHIIVVILLFGLAIELIDIPLHLSFIVRSGIVRPSSLVVCLMWWLADLGSYNGITIFMAWGSFERHILVFHDRWMATRKKRLILHYLPLISLFIYIAIFYMIAIFFPNCVNTFDYTLPVCNDHPCYLNDPILGIWNSVLNGILPTMLIGFFTGTLLIRIYRQKRRAGQRLRWSQQRKMSIQLVPICLLYLLINIPLNLLILSRLCGLPDDAGVETQAYFDFLTYSINLLFPFLCLGTLPELRKRVHPLQLITLRHDQYAGTIATI